MGKGKDDNYGDPFGQKSDGLTFFGLYNSPVFYNSDKDKFKERTAWVGPNDGIVVFTEKDGQVKDLNDDGKITSAEIALTRVVDKTTTDMEALYRGFDKGIDTDKDGKTTLAEGKNDHKITWQEADAHGLRIWRDANVNGVLDAGEMVTFQQAGVDVIDLNDTNADKLKDANDDKSHAGADSIIEARFSDGSVIFGTAKVTLTNGDTTTAYDVGFAHESVGMLEHKDASGFIDMVKLERAVGTQKDDWQYREADANSTGVVWKFGDNSKYYGATGSAFTDTMTYDGTLRRSFSGGAGDDFIQTGDGDDFLIGGAGADKLFAGGGNDVIYIDAEDTNGNAGYNNAGIGKIDGGDGFDVVKVNSAAGVWFDVAKTNTEAFFGGDGDDTVPGGLNHLKSMILFGGGGKDALYGAKNDDYIMGGDGDDLLIGNQGNDYLIGGAGVDKINGGYGDDVVVADELDYFNDVPDFFNSVSGDIGFDILTIDDSVDDTKVFSKKLDLIAMGFEAASGGDGDDIFTVNPEENTFLFGMKGNDTLTTGIGDDLLGGGVGNDTMNGNGGSDTYLFGREDGNDTIAEIIDVAADGKGGLDAIAFGADIDADDLQFSLSGGNLLISLRKADGEDLSGETITISDWSARESQVEILAFADGTVLDIGGANFTTLGGGNDSNAAADKGGAKPDSVGASMKLDVIDAGAGNDRISAWDGNDIVFGRQGDDRIAGGNGHDYLSGGSGNDILKGEADDDTLMGGSGNDNLAGGDGKDYLDGGKGSDTIDGGNGQDQLYGGDGNDDLDSGNGDDVLVGGKGNDRLIGGLGDDIYLIGRDQGVDVISDTGSDDDFHMVTTYKGEWQARGENDAYVRVPVTKKVFDDPKTENRYGDRIAFGDDITLTDLVFDMQDDGDLIIGISRNGSIYDKLEDMTNRVTVKDWNKEDHQIERLNFSNGAVLYVEEIDDAYRGTNKANDYDDSRSRNSLISGGNGNDRLEGHKGDDVILGGNGGDTVYGQEGNDTIFGGAGNDMITGDAGNDRLFGGDGDDSIFGNGSGPGNSQGGIDDYIVGGAGNDTLHGASGSDTYVFGYGDGNDFITEEGSDGPDNIIAFGDGIWLSDIKVEWDSSKSTLKMELLPLNRPTESPTTIRVEKNVVSSLHFVNGYYAAFSNIANGRWGTEAGETFDFSDSKKAAVWLSGNDGEDILKGGGGRDYLVGGRHDDILQGGNNSDYYIYNYGDGRDTIIESGEGKNGKVGGEADSLVFGPGISLYDLAMKMDGNDLIIALRDDDRQNFNPEMAENQVRIKNWHIDDCRVEWLDFAIGQSFEIGKIDGARFLGASNDIFDGNGTAQWIDSGTGNDKIKAGGGDDVVFGRDGNDEIDGGDDDDQLYGEDGNDDITGGKGNDYLYGGEGDDGLKGNSGDDKLFGFDGDDVLRGGSGGNLLNGGLGNDTIYRGGFKQVTKTTYEPVFDEHPQGRPETKTTIVSTSYTTVEFFRGDGQDTLYVAEPKDADTSGSHDHIDLYGIVAEEVWLQKNKDDLILKILGTEDQMTFIDYYKGDGYQFAHINAGGETLDHDDIGALVKVMSDYNPNNGDDGAGISMSDLPDQIIDLIHKNWHTGQAYDGEHLVSL